MPWHVIKSYRVVFPVVLGFNSGLSHLFFKSSVCTWRWFGWYRRNDASFPFSYSVIRACCDHRRDTHKSCTTAKLNVIVFVLCILLPLTSNWVTNGSKETVASHSLKKYYVFSCFMYHECFTSGSLCFFQCPECRMDGAFVQLLRGNPGLGLFTGNLL